MAYNRAKFFWGAIDIIHSDESPYSPQQTFPLGENGLPPGIGVRRAQLVFSRLTLAPPQDAMTTHLDFLNLTAGQPDDTWIDADFIELEQKIDAWIGSLLALMSSAVVFDQLRWYRVGPEVLPPNPAVRVTDFNKLGTGTNSLPHQVAASVTLKTVPRRQWGRMYLPLLSTSALSNTGRFTDTSVSLVGQQTDQLVLGSIAAEKPPVIFSKVRGKAYTVEHVQVDNVPDVIRSRRFNEATFKYISP